MLRYPFFLTVISLLFLADSAQAQTPQALERIEATAENKPLSSLAVAGAQARETFPFRSEPTEVVNFMFEGRPLPDLGKAAINAAAAIVQQAPGSAPIALTGGFPGASNNDNGAVLGVLIAPPDTDGEVGPNHFVQMINLLTTIYDKNGNVVTPSFPSNAIWAGIGGNCEPFNKGDPIVLYDDQADRWLVSQFAFPNNFSTFSQCVAISQTGDPTGAYNRYEFSFDGFGFNDYPKHGIVTDSITMIANLFQPSGGGFFFTGTFLGVMDKNAMYAGDPATLLGLNIGNTEFGFVAGDLDGPGTSEALFATAMSNFASFDIWQIDVDWGTQQGDATQIASIPITPFDSDLCFASREACIPQPNGGPSLEAISDRLMHRLQIRDFGAYRTMLASHTVDVGGGRAGIRWYELRENAGTWSLYQEGTYGPADGEHRWMPSAAMNAAGDIGIGYMVASNNTFVSTAVSGQSASNSGSGQLDGTETFCALGTGVQQNTARSGDYSATTIDPSNDSFWHTNEVFFNTGNFQWSTFVCSFTVPDGGGNVPPNAAFTSSCTDLTCNFSDTSSDSDGTVVEWAWDFGDGATSDAQNPSHTYLAAGDYAVTLTVTDDDGDTGTITQTVTATDPAANVPPTAAFSSSCTDLTCSFSDASSDSDGTVVGWAWSFGDGATSNAQNPSHTYAAAGEYAVTLTVTDDDGATGTITQTVTVTEPVANVPPTAAFSSSCTNLTCNFTDTSSDSDGTVVDWAWSFGDGATSNAQNPSHTYASVGDYAVTLTVTDDDGDTGTITQTVTVTGEGNVPPTAAYSSSCSNFACDFSDLSTDADGTVVGWAWDFGDGTTSNAQNPSHTYPNNPFFKRETYPVTLTVTDDAGDTGTITRTITVIDQPNVPPTADFSSSCSELTCSFTDASADGDGTVVGWAWSFGDGATSNLQDPSHTYATAGDYAVTLTVTDDDGDTGTTTQTVTVTGPPNVPPTADFSSSCSELTCSFTDASADSDGTVVGWAWSFGDGATSNAQNPSHTYATAGDYAVTLTVTDDDGDTGTTTQTVTVTEPGVNIPPTAAFSSSCSNFACDFSDLSTDSDGTVVGWAWDFGDGTTSNAQNPSHTYPNNAFFRRDTYPVTLTVTDNDGATATITVVINVL